MAGHSASLALHPLSNMQMGCLPLLMYFDELISSNSYSLTVGGRYHLLQLSHSLRLGPLAMFPPTSGKLHVLNSGSHFVKHDAKCHRWFWDHIIYLRRKKTPKTQQSGNQTGATCKDNSASPGRILRSAPPQWIMQ